MSNTKKAIFVFLYTIAYILLNVAMGHPLFGNVCVDFGYIPIMILAVMASEIGAYPAVICGTAGYTVYSVFLSKEGFSCGEFAAVLIISTGIAWCCYMSKSNVWAVTPIVCILVIVSEIVNTAIECWIFPLPVKDEIVSNLLSGVVEIFILMTAYSVGVVFWAVISGEDID